MSLRTLSPDVIANPVTRCRCEPNRPLSLRAKRGNLVGVGTFAVMFNAVVPAYSTVSATLRIDPHSAGPVLYYRERRQVAR